MHAGMRAGHAAQAAPGGEAAGAGAGPPPPPPAAPAAVAANVHLVWGEEELSMVRLLSSSLCQAPPSVLAVPGAFRRSVCVLRVFVASFSDLCMHACMPPQTSDSGLQGRTCMPA